MKAKLGKKLLNVIHFNFIRPCIIRERRYPKYHIQSRDLYRCHFQVAEKRKKEKKTQIKIIKICRRNSYMSAKRDKRQQFPTFTPSAISRGIL